MATLTITLSRAEQAFVRARVKGLGLRSAREYIEQLILMDQLKREPERVDALLLEGLRDRPATPMTRKDWEAIEREGLSRLAEEKKPAGRRPKKPRRPG
jgi:hypothetical protein